MSSTMQRLCAPACLVTRLRFPTCLHRCAPVRPSRCVRENTPMPELNSWSLTSMRCLHGRRGSRSGKLSGNSAMEMAMDADEESYSSLPDDPRKDTRLHQPVMLNEVISFFAPTQNQTFLDMTFGGGGHTQALLQSAPGVKVHALDRDPVAYRIAEELGKYHENHLFPLLGAFSEVRELLSQRGVVDGSIDGILIDAGCSSFQLDSPERGFSLSRDGPLDMRMDVNRHPMQPTAADVVNSVDFSTLSTILRTYGEESHAKKIAQAIIDYRTNFHPFTSTQELATVVACCFTHHHAKSSRDKLGRRSHTATKTFQALRIFVNNELNELAVGLEAARDLLRPGGKLAVLSFHSLEDRVVKRTLQGRDVAEKGSSLRQKRLAVGEDIEEEGEGSGSGWRMVSKKVLPPDDEEVEANPRARSAKLRTAIKI